MGQDRLDRFIKKQVEEHKTPTDPDLLWQKIQAKRNAEKKPKRRFLTFWLSGGVFLLLGFALLSTFQLSDTNSKQYDDTLITKENSIGNNLPAEKTAETKSVLKNSKDTKQTTELNRNTSQSSNLAIDDKISNAASFKNTISKSPDFNSTASAKNIGRSTNTLARTQQSITKNYFKSVRNNEKSEISANPNPNTPQAFEKNESLKISTTNLAEKQETDSAMVEPQKEETSTLEFENKNQDKSTEEILKGRAKEKQWRLSNGASFTYGKALRTLSNRASDPSDYLQTREEMETALDAFRINLDFMMQHRSGFYLNSGLEYDQINERFDSYTEWDSIVTVPNQLLAIIYDINGTVSETKGMAEVKTTHWLRKKIYNRYRSIDIPLTVGYQSTKEGKRLGWFVEGGASINLWFNASGEIFDANDQSVALENNTDLFKTRTGISLTGAAGLTYKVANKFSIWASPDIKYQLSSVTSDNNTLGQKYLNTGLRVGIRYHLK